jgi:hypothetical protein
MAPPIPAPATVVPTTVNLSLCFCQNERECLWRVRRVCADALGSANPKTTNINTTTRIFFMLCLSYEFNCLDETSCKCSVKLMPGRDRSPSPEQTIKSRQRLTATMLLKFSNPRLNLSRPLIWIGGKFDFGSRLERFILFNEFDCLHLLPDSFACAARHHEA